ncbi:hypothetical protein Gotur_008973 [Gossypium turneri]
MIQIKVKEFLQKMYGDANFKFNFSIVWLEQFKARHEIKSYRRFGESEGLKKKKTRKDLLLWFVAIGMVQIKCLFGLLVSLLILDALNILMLE